MKSLVIKLIIPLTVISFATVTKWWYALPDDAPDTLFAGFPFPFVCNGWHTSLSLQIFAGELIIDFLIYFSFWLTLIYLIQRFLIKINPHKICTITLWTLAGLVTCWYALISFNPENLLYIKRPFHMEVMETGYKFTFQNIERPDFHKYHPEFQKKIKWKK